MISKEYFVKFLSNYQKFDNALERIEKSIIGKRCYSIDESDWAEAVGQMLDLFIYSHFTSAGVDLICAYLWEKCREFWIDIDGDLFSNKRREHYTFETLEDLYDVMLKFKEGYFLG